MPHEPTLWSGSGIAQAIYTIGAPTRTIFAWPLTSSVRLHDGQADFAWAGGGKHAFRKIASGAGLRVRE